MKKSFDKIFERRIILILLFFLVAYGALASRLFLMQIVRHGESVRMAARQHGRSEEISSERGTIFAGDKTGASIPFALNKTYKILIASPKLIANSEETASVIAEAFHLDKADVMAKLAKKNDPYEVLARKIESDAADQFAAQAGLPRNTTLATSVLTPSAPAEGDIRGLPVGISFEDETRRIYPHGRMAANTIGFVSSDQGVESGKYGIEKFYNTELSGARGLWEGAKDALGFWIALGRRIVRPPKDGASILLTIDYPIQRKAEEILSAARKKWDAASGLVIVMDPKTGRILADARDPTFDPNEFFKEKDFGIFLNPMGEASYEFGSVMKPITMAGALEEKLVTPATTYNDTGEIKIGSFTIRNFDGNAYHTMSMTQVLEKSLNTGVVYVARLLGKKKQEEYLRAFGFGARTGVDLPGEVAGDLSNLKSGRDSDFATASFGQGIAITPIQLAAAMGAIANKGILMKPYVVEKITDDSGNVAAHNPEVVRQVISSATAEILTKMLVSVVKNGYEDRAGVKGYFIAGKTGTAQMPKKDGRGYSDMVIHTFVGYAPAFDPKFLILLQLNEPQGNRFAANTLTTVFHDLAEFILHYYEVPPDEK
ncbi:MAG: penicillin-binding protein 2 [Candidatus Sungiibacteriota bacterium]